MRATGICGLLCLTPLTLTAVTPGQGVDLSEYFGFAPLEIIRVGNDVGPAAVADLNDDGLNDLIVVNNYASRIELHLQKRDASPDDEPETSLRPNELPEHWRFRRELISVSHKVLAAVAHDYDDDGMMDLIYAGLPPELVFVRQSAPGVFEVARRHRIRKLSANRSGLAVADVIGDDAPELLALVGGQIHIWPLDGDQLGPPTELKTGQAMVAFSLADFDGNGRTDIAGVIPDDPAPIRIWRGLSEHGRGALGPESRFESASLVEFDAIRFPDHPRAALARIERASKRVVIGELDIERIAQVGDRDAVMQIHSFTDAGNRSRSVVVIDADGDGLTDLIATDTEANALVAYYQKETKGLQAGASFPNLSDLTYLAAADVDDDPMAELFVLSEKEGIVGRSDVEADGTIPFPLPLGISDGFSPVALNVVQLEHGPHVAVVVKSGREYLLDLIAMDGARESIKLGSLSRSPETIIALDADQNDRTDLLLFTRDRPMTMLYAEEDGFRLMESKDMGQFGLVQVANADNTAVFDIDGDGRNELLLADKNFVRAVRYEPSPAEGASPGWQVVRQINARDSTSKLVSLSILNDRIIAADKENDRLVVLAPSGDAGAPSTSWGQFESISVRGFSFSRIFAGSFAGDGDRNIIALGDDGFAVVRFAGERLAMRDFATWRSDQERRFHHELHSGDINGDGFTDMVALDAGEQMCEIFTFSQARELHYVTGFKVFESKIFSGGDTRQYQPSQILIADVTGDDADDLVLVCHDRILVYPQMTDRPETPARPRLTSSD